MYRYLNSENTIETIRVLNKRIDERFSGSGLSKVCAELHRIAIENQARSERIARPDYRLRIVVAGIIVTSLGALIFSVTVSDITPGRFDFGELVQVIESGINNLVLIGAAMFFLISMETRLKRSRALDALHELRAIAHVIDMHQLTKDPSAYMSKVIYTRSSPRHNLTAYELTRYLDYCSEMLSLTGKVAALYAQKFHDAYVISVVNEIESLCTGLSRKIWQKIMILNRLSEE